MLATIILLASLSIVLIAYISINILPDNDRKIEEGLEIKTSPYATWAIATLAIVLVIFFTLIATNQKIETNIGVIGDFFGGLLNPIFSLITILILLKVSSIQSAEFKKSASSIQSQKEIYKLEKFENTLFKLVDQLEKHAENFDAITKKNPDNSTKTISKRQSLTQSLEKLTSEETFANLPIKKQYSLIKELIFKESKKASDQNIAMVRRLCMAIEHIDKSKLSKEKKSFYYNLLMISVPIRTIYLASMFALPLKSKRPPRKIIKKSGLTKRVIPDLYYIDLIKRYYT